jgi:O-antigen ligase
VSERLTFTHGVAALSPGLGPQPQPRPAIEHEAARPAPVVRAAVREPRADAAYWGVFGFTALLLFRPQDSIPLLEPLHLPEVCALTAALSMTIRRTNRGLAPIPWTPEVGGIVAISLIMLLTAPFSVWPAGAISTFTDLYMKVLLIFVILVHTLASPALLRRFTWLIVMAMGWASMNGVLDYVRGVNLMGGERLQGAVPGLGLMGNPNDLAMNMVAFMPFAAFKALAPGKPLARLVAGGIVLMMLATILFTKSRGGFLGLAVVAFLVIVQARRIRPGIATAAVLALLVIPPFLPQTFWTRASSIFNAEEDTTGSREARIELMQDAWRTFNERPFLGVGAGQFQNYNPPERLQPWHETHNVEMQLLTELGVVGFGAFVWFLVRSAMTLAATWRALRPRRRSSREPDGGDAFGPGEREWMRLHVAACIAAFAGWLVCAQFGSIGYYWTLYYIVAMIVAAHLITVARLAPAAAPRRTAA